MTRLPDRFIQDMDQLFERFALQREQQAFLAAFQEVSCTGLRANELKIGRDALQAYLSELSGLPPDVFCPIPWSRDGLTVPPRLQPGRLAAHAAGLYYIQEPSAMLPAAVLAARPGERILDLCAAPGGKATRLAADLTGSGLLWANEISPQRVRALQRTIELTGCINAIVTRETPERLAAALPEWFDAVLVDAPCSGAGMFRRDPGALRSYQQYGSAHYVPMQRSILEAAWQLLRPGGRLVYATCTFSLDENEAMISWLCNRYEDCRILPIEKMPGVDDGLPYAEGLVDTARIWPHRSAGDGHFCALLGKRKDNDQRLPDPTGYRCDAGQPADWQLFDAFCQNMLTETGQQRVVSWLQQGQKRLENDHLHLLPASPAALANLVKVKTGLFLGTLYRKAGKAIRYDPSQAFLLSLRSEDLRYSVAETGDSDLVSRFLRGETLQLPQDPNRDGWPVGATVAVQLCTATGHFPLGWSRLTTPPLLKNMYPPGWTRPVQGGQV